MNLFEVRMRKLLIGSATGVLLLLASSVQAQGTWTTWTPLDSRLVVSINGGGQFGTSDFDARTSFPLYDEQAEILTNQKVGGGGIFDIGAAYRVGANWGAGFAFNTAGGSGDAVVAGTLPHPAVFDQPRTFTSSASDLEHKEHAVHLQAVWFVPFTDKVSFMFAGGPSFFGVKQTFVTGVDFTEQPPNYNSVTVNSLSTTERSESGAGFNISGDMNYSFTPNLGAGFLLRYTRGTAGFDFGDQKVNVHPGGFQIAVGARIRL
jgi:hypothetical protein